MNDFSGSSESYGDTVFLTGSLSNKLEDKNDTEARNSSSNDKNLSSSQIVELTLFGTIAAEAVTCTDISGKRAVFFVFPDLCLKIHGTFRLKFTLSRIPSPPPTPQNNTSSPTQVFSLPSYSLSSLLSSDRAHIDIVHGEGGAGEGINGDDKTACEKSQRLAVVVSEPFKSYTSRTFPGVVGEFFFF